MNLTDMDMEHMSGNLAIAMKANGFIISGREKDIIAGETGTNIMEAGWETKEKVLGPKFTKMDHYMKEAGKMTREVAKVN